MRETYLALIDARTRFIAMTGKEPRELHIPMGMAKELAREIKTPSRPATLMGMHVIVHADATTFWLK